MGALYSADIINFVGNISHEPLPERPIKGSERFNADMIDGKRVPRTVHLPSAGPRRLIDAIAFRDGYQMERVAFDEQPELHLYRIQMLQVEVLVLAWRWDDNALTDFVLSARPIQGDDELLAEIEQAEYGAWEKIRKRER